MIKIKPLPERKEQQLLVEWARYKRIPLVHIPNEGKRMPREGLNLLKAGLSPGFPDLLVPMAHGGYFGLFLEVKRNRKYSASEMKTHTWKNQLAWINYLNNNGYCAKIIYGAGEGVKVIENYLSLMPTLSNTVQLLGDI